MESSEVANAESWIYWLNIAKLIAAFLVAIGVAVEFGGEWIARPFERVVERARHEQDNNRQLEIENAKTEAANARIRAAEIERKYAWRSISSPQEEFFMNELQGVKFNLVLQYFTSDPEAYNFASIAMNMLSKTSLSVTPHNTIPLVPPIGIVLFGPENADKVKLGQALKAAGLSFRISSDQITAVDDVNSLRMSIGGRLPPQ